MKPKLDNVCVVITWRRFAAVFNWDCWMWWTAVTSIWGMMSHETAASGHSVIRHGSVEFSQTTTASNLLPTRTTCVLMMYCSSCYCAACCDDEGAQPAEMSLQEIRCCTGYLWFVPCYLTHRWPVWPSNGADRWQLPPEGLFMIGPRWCKVWNDR